ncbi:MAG TPA: tetratricopeptide repeat protein [Anaerohalosphaeraceae bacterium]|nr:tetratricopeptide repeat protein [Phycisphaerae bacterium]HOK96018.1 tetratricopeptide repeat protein [Anaerohalosphaeraceae bacterium]HOM74972.1 tetratricopeptide repeat protein [Anaerohalosphaeraceae bacterium]HPC63224.1 tetratricopeptide repeat protein [Anaerohalosphaeraceae bacterium]HRS70328.1 tetratricopeptide repeat protein [Anaerohalosphaeraceae bacterium]
MSKLFEIFGKGITISTADIIWHWLGQMLPPADSSSNDVSFVKILDHLANREIVQAEEIIRSCLIKSPDCVWARMAASAVCLMQDNIAESLQHAQSVYFRQPSNTMALYVMGYCCERLGQPEQALEFYQDCVKFKRHLQLPHQRMAAIYLRDGGIDKAAAEYEQITAEHYEDIQSLVLLGYLYLDSGKIEQAIDALNLAIVSHPDNFMEFHEPDEIETLIQDEMFEQAIERIRWTIEQIGTLPDLVVRMADIYSAWGKEAEALACYEHAVHLQPSSLEAAIKLATHYLRSHRFSLAAEQFNRAADINEEIVDAYMGLAIAQETSDHSEAALETLSLASAILQNSILLYSESACLQFQSVIDETFTDTAGRTIVSANDVIKAYKEQLKYSGSRPDVNYKYGILMIGENNLPLASCLFEKTLDINPMYYRARHKLALCAFMDGHPQKALKILRNNPSAGKTVFEKYYQLSILYSNRKKFSEAIRQLSVLETSDMADLSQTQANLEIILENLGLIDRTMTSWQRLNETSECLVKIKEKKPISNVL